MNALRIFCVAIFALLLASCTKQGYSEPVCGLAQILNWITWGAAEGFEEEVCHPEPTETTAANGSQVTPKQTPSPNSSPTASAAPPSQTIPDPSQSLAKNPCDCNGATY